MRAVSEKELVNLLLVTDAVISAIGLTIEKEAPGAAGALYRHSDKIRAALHSLKEGGG